MQSDQSFWAEFHAIARVGADCISVLRKMLTDVANVNLKGLGMHARRNRGKERLFSAQVLKYVGWTPPSDEELQMWQAAKGLTRLYKGFAVNDPPPLYTIRVTFSEMYDLPLTKEELSLIASK